MDISTIWNPQTSTGDWQIAVPSALIWTDENGNSIRDQFGRPVSSQFTTGGDLVVGNDLQSAVLISLFSDAEASDDDIVPDGTTDPRGWWAGPIGSKLWLRTRAKATPALPLIVKKDCEDALAWLIGDGVAAAVDVTAEYDAPGMLAVQVVLRRRDGARAAVRFSRLWEAQ